MNNKFKSISKKYAKSALIVATFGGIFVAGSVFAGPDNGVALSAISTNIQHTVGHLANILTNIALIAGIGFVMASFFKFHQHKLNPTQVPLSQGVTLMLIGAGLTLFPIMVPTAKNAVIGSSAKVSHLSGAGMKTLIGVSGG
ncbi:MAG: type IV secretion protein IcmD [Coxiella sp. (in: Bacteria)]|nr:MAG: type IV secretion protein IcmD [Coxiella sp. (in: g-proteobacteria)]